MPNSHFHQSITGHLTLINQSLEAITFWDIAQIPCWSICGFYDHLMMAPPLHLRSYGESGAYTNSRGWTPGFLDARQPRVQ